MGFSRGLAAEVGRDGVTVNCIALGTMNHGQLAEAIEQTPSSRRSWRGSYPVGPDRRTSTTPAPLAVLLCSDAAEWITGQVYPVDGGYALGALMGRAPMTSSCRPGTWSARPAARGRDRDRGGRRGRTTSPTSASPTSPRTTSSTTGCGRASPSTTTPGCSSVRPVGSSGTRSCGRRSPDAELEGDAFVLPEYAGRGLGTPARSTLIEDRGPRARCAVGPMTLGVFASQREHRQARPARAARVPARCTPCCGSRSTWSQPVDPTRSSRPAGS